MKKQEFVYEYPYTKEQLWAELNDRRGWAHNWDGGDYLIQIKNENAFFLGVERGGHSRGGRWYIARTEENNAGTLTIRGGIVCDPDENGIAKKEPLTEIITFWFLFVLLLPIVIAVKTIKWIRYIWLRIRKKPLPRPGAEENLDNFMLNYLGCKRI